MHHKLCEMHVIQCNLLRNDEQIIAHDAVHSVVYMRKLVIIALNVTVSYQLLQLWQGKGCKNTIKKFRRSGLKKAMTIWALTMHLH